MVEINAETAATGMPMVRPMFLQFPLDAVAQTASVEDQYMFGEDEGRKRGGGGGIIACLVSMW